MSNLPSTLFELMQGRQNKRILLLSFRNNDGPSSLLLARKLTASEELPRDFEYPVEVLAEDANLPIMELEIKAFNSAMKL